MKKNNQGTSLIEVMVAIGIMGIIMLGMTTMQSNQMKETHGLQDALARLDLEKTLIYSLSGGAVCKFVLSDPSQSSTSNPPNRSIDKIDTSSSAALAKIKVFIQKIPGSASASAPIIVNVNGKASANSNLKVSEMVFSNFRPNGVDQFLSDFKLSFDSSTSVRQLAPIIIQNVNIVTNAADPANAKTMMDCAPPRGTMPLLRRYIFNSTQSWTVPSGVASGFVTMAAGGGSGLGWRVGNAWISGHSGGYVFSHPVNFVPGETLNIVVGKGGIAFSPIKGAPAKPGPPYFIQEAPTGDDGLGGYPGGASQIISPTLGVLLECDGGSGASTGGIDAYDGKNTAGNLASASFGSGSPKIAAPNRVAAGPYAASNKPGACGPNNYGVGNPGTAAWDMVSGSHVGGATPFGFGSGGEISISGCYVTASTGGTCVYAGAGRDGVVYIDVMY